MTGDERTWTLYGPHRVHSQTDARFFIIEPAKVEPPLAYEEAVEVMSVSEHEAALAAVRQVDEASQRIVRHIAGMIFPESGHPYGSIPRQLVYDARSALTVPEPEEKR